MEQSLSFNQFKGPIPEDWIKLQNLKVMMDFGANKFSGSIPDNLSQLSNLQYLSLNDNTLSGTLPASLGKLSKLQYLVSQRLEYALEFVDFGDVQ
ncbi:hypothetical protein HDU97_009586 [Phlyctochytrium planicorne]|nr:hypothetical protein HDU97_009586 [Phlyctochytrium planicorne]